MSSSGSLSWSVEESCSVVIFFRVFSSKTKPLLTTTAGGSLSSEREKKRSQCTKITFFYSWTCIFKCPKINSWLTQNANEERLVNDSVSLRIFQVELEREAASTFSLFMNVFHMSWNMRCKTTWDNASLHRNSQWMIMYERERAM